MIDNNTKHFILGTLFAYSLYQNTPPFHIVSISAIYYFIFTKINDKFYRKVDFTLDLHKLTICTVIYLIESKIFRFLHFKIIMRLGVFLLVLGFFFSLYSNYYLLSKKKVFVFTGPFSFMRHPFYFGCMVMILGGVIYLNCYFMLTFFVICYKSIFIDHIKSEEEEMVKVDGNYRKYMNSVKMFWF